VSLLIDGNVGAMVKLKSETDFVASSDGFINEANELVKLVAAKGEGAISERQQELEDLKILLKEKIELGEIVRMEAAAGNILDSYTHIQGGRGVNGVLVEMSGATPELAHDIAVHIAFARPRYLRREDVPTEVIEAERATLETLTRNEGKPEQAIAKIVEGRIGGFFKDICLLEQPYAKDDKVSISQLIGSASIVRFAQVEIG
jgi:elongation factor Ts